MKLPSRGFSTSDAFAMRCLMDQAQGNLGQVVGGFAQAANMKFQIRDVSPFSSCQQGLQEPFEQFGSLLGLLAPYTYTSLATSHLWATECIACLLNLQDQSITMDAMEEELRGLHEELKACSLEHPLASYHMVKATCASLKMLTTIHSSPVLRELLPEILCALLEQVGNTVWQDMPVPMGSIWRRQLRPVGNLAVHQKDQEEDQNPEGICPTKKSKEQAEAGKSQCEVLFHISHAVQKHERISYW
ncbi:hypothetical protein Y1Q_0006585 [Alligator mississippiensis]|uniref:Maestro-like HEAT-repeats domain-containing protein n=1 Tax=Alligator mississippiensis TaxID=8496 RepID=A0A151NT54_ALLMI|nr:hypothetical protein Y1Q_0006585 [Alligator mississippiensis]